MIKDEFVEQPVPPSSLPYRLETRPATYKDKLWWNRCCSLFWVYVILLIAFIAGCVLLPLGLKYKNQIKDMDSSIDFTLLSEQCTLETVTWIKQVQKTGDKGRHEGCDDIWELVFDASSLPEENSFYDGRDDYSFKGIDLRISRDCKSCSRCDRKVPDFFVGMEADCWRPTVPDVTTEEGELNEWYRCGNDDCVKILPPQDDIDRAKGISGALFIAGIVCLAVSAPGAAGLFLADKLCIPRPTVTEQVYDDQNPAIFTNSASNPPPIFTAHSNNHTATTGATSDTVGAATIGTSGGAPSLFDQLKNKA